MSCPIIPASDVPAPRRRSPITWPLNDLALGEAFLIPTVDGRDADGRHEETIRALICKFNKKLNRRFGCRRMEKGLMVIRIA
jgi:hypothetical protein